MSLIITLFTSANKLVIKRSHTLNSDFVMIFCKFKTKFWGLYTYNP